MADCSCHGLPKAPNRQCVIKRREAQRRYEVTDKGRAVLRRYKRSERARVTRSILGASKTIRKYTPGTPEYQANVERVVARWTK